MKTCVLAYLLLPLTIIAAGHSNADDGRGKEIDIVILGDTSFGENYHDQLAEVGDEPVLYTRGYDHMIANFAEILRGADFTVANLETAITDRFPSPYHGRKRYIHYANVEKTPQHLQKHGFDLVSLANNHAFDFGAKGLEQTLQLLGERNIETCGAGLDAAGASKPHVQRFEVGQTPFHIAFLCSFEYRESYDERYGFYAGDGKAGVNELATNTVAERVRSLRERYTNLLIVAYPHWGKNYAWANERQRTQAHALIDVGVDLIIGHGSHAVQELERYKGRWIVYSLGNFVFGSKGRYAKHPVPPFGAIATLRLSPSSKGANLVLRLHPIFSNNRVTHYQPRFATRPEFHDLALTLRARSQTGTAFEERVRTGTDDYGSYLELDIER